MAQEHGRGFFTLNPRRKSKNVLLQPFLQLKLPIAVIGLTLLFAGLVGWHTQATFLELFRFALREVGDPAIYEHLLGQMQRASVLLGLAVLAGYVLVVTTLCVVYAHRMIGPTIAFRRHIEALKNGDYTARVKLRPGDAFQDVADDLNELAGILGEVDKPV